MTNPNDPDPQSPRAPRPFLLLRHRDVSGVSGTGVVAEGTQWTDGTASLRWRGEHPVVAFWQSGIEAIVAVHGHGGSTEVCFVPSDGRAASTLAEVAGRRRQAGDHQDVGGFCSCCGTVAPCHAMRRGTAPGSLGSAR
jgi:hypothetical protein